MALEAFSEEWSRACCEQLNARERFRSFAADWISPVVLVMKAHPASGLEQDRAVYLDLFRGECRGARVADSEDFRRAEFVLLAEVATWRRLLHGEQDPISAVLFGKLKLDKGAIAALMPYAAAAREMVAAAAEIDARLPGDPG